MTPTPNGHLTPTATGQDLVLQRTFRAPIEDVWASLTEPERTARWFGSWSGEPGVGNTVQVKMAFEEEGDPMSAKIIACDPPSYLAVTTNEGPEAWRLEARLTEADGITTLLFVQHLDATDGVPDIGPGWEYYLDNLVAAHWGNPKPAWDDYYPSMKPYYEALSAG
jgi:uncharacterized protein YndB with AHSA1/START domain